MLNSKKGIGYGMNLDMTNSLLGKFKLTSSKKLSPAFLLLLIAAILPVIFFLTLQIYKGSARAQEITFSFGAVGDHGFGSSGAAVLKAAGAANLNFFTSLGDLSYQGNETGWCQWVKDNINAGAGKAMGDSYGENFPFMIIAGGHENGVDNAGDGVIDNFVAPNCLPDRMGVVQSPNLGTNGSPTAIGNYAKEYYFDYPQTNPIARFIMLSPEQNFLYGGCYDFGPGICTSPDADAHYNWMLNAIDSARSAGIKWVIVANHEQFISTGIKGDEIGSRYFNGLIDRKVDLILQGHDHNKQRSKQLAFGTDCSSISASSSTNNSCIVDDGLDGVYEKGKGSVLLINGHGGVGTYNTSSSDAQNGYFATWDHSTMGFYKLTVSDTQIAGEFVKGQGLPGSFTDSFTISDSGTPQPTPTPTPTSSPTTTPTPTPVPTTQTFIPLGSTWKYLDNNTRPVGWETSTFDDASWKTGPAELGYGDGDEKTVVSFGSNSSAKYITTYFRKGFSVTSASSFSKLDMVVERDDGVVVYLNGTEVHRGNMPTSTITHTTLASSSIEDTTTTVSVNPALLREGTNVIAAEIHQGSASSSDISFNLSLTGSTTSPPPPPPSPTPTPAPTPTPTPSGTTQTVVPLADSYVNKNNPTRNYGTATSINVDGSPILMSYLKFDLTPFAARTLISAKLRMKVTNESKGSQNIKQVNDLGWAETSLNYNNRPAMGTTYNSFSNTAQGSTIEVDISSAVAGNIGQLFSLGMDSPSSDGFAFSSRETVDKPALVLQLE